MRLEPLERAMQAFEPIICFHFPQEATLKHVDALQQEILETTDEIINPLEALSSTYCQFSEQQKIALMLAEELPQLFCYQQRTLQRSQRCSSIN